MAITSPALTLAVPALFGNIKPTVDALRKLGPTDFSAGAPEYTVAPGATIKVPVSSIAAASPYNASNNNYLTGGSTTWANFESVHYLQGFDVSGVNDSIFRFLETGEILDSQCDEIGKNLVRYVSFLEKSNNKEALAHLASRFEQTDYQRAVLFVLDHASEVYDKVMAFISNL